MILNIIKIRSNFNKFDKNLFYFKNLENLVL